MDTKKTPHRCTRPGAGRACTLARPAVGRVHRCRNLALAGGLLMTVAAAQAQGRPSAEGDAPAAAVQLAEAPVVLQRLLFEDGASLPPAADERVVAGAPYCADAVHETVQWLVDGNGGAPDRIVRQVETRLCRDGQGRTRQETERGGRKLVYLRDPVARESWVLDPERRLARRLADTGLPGAMALPGPSLLPDPGADASAWRAYADRMREWARNLAERARGGLGGAGAAPALPPLPAPALIAPPEPGASGPRSVDIRVLRLPQADAGALAGEWALPPPAVQWRAQALAPRGRGVTTPLGSRDIEGLRADGERTTWTIEAGRVGNDKPIAIVREVWTAPELMLTVSTRDFDPRSGETSYRLKNLRRGEPDAALMRVPPDYARPGPAAPRPAG